MERAAVTLRFASTVLVVSLLCLVVLGPKSSRAGEGDPKTPPVDAKGGKPYFTLLNPDKLPADATPEARLNAARVKVDWSHADGITLQPVLTDLGRTIDLPIIFSTGAKEIFEDCKLSCSDSDVFSADRTLQNISARGYLDYVFHPMHGDLFWEIRDGKIVVNSFEEMPEGMESMLNRVYRLDKLSELKNDVPVGCCGGDGFAGDGFCYDTITELVTCTIDPESWQEVGGPGTISTMELAGAKVLVVRNSWDVQEQVASLLDSIEQMLDAKDLVVERSLHVASAENVTQAMQKKITLDVEEMPLSRFLAELGKQAEIPILLDRISLEELGYSVDTPITYRCKEKPLRLVEDCLWTLELTWVSRFGVLEATTQEEAEQNLSTSVFEVTDLTKWPGYEDFDMDSLIELITSTVDPEYWQEVGGVGTISPVCLKGRAFLVIRQTEWIMEEVRQSFAGLRAIRDKTCQSFPQISKADREVLDKLDKKLKWDIEEGTTLPGFLASLEKRLDVMTRVDRYSLECIGVSPDLHEFESIRVDDWSAANLLSLILGPSGMDWDVRHGELFISTQEELGQRLSTTLYEVSDLTIYTDTQGKVGHDVDSLICLITSTADPEGWMEVGGPGSVSPYSLGEKQVLAIRQTSEGHKQIAQLLADLRAAMPKDLAKRIPPVRSEPLFERPTALGAGGQKAGGPKKLPKHLPSLHPKQGQLVEANNAFAVKLYGQMARLQDGAGQGDRAGQGGPRVVRRESFCFSPYSIVSMMQVIKAGTRGETDRELKKALCLSLSGDDLHGAYGSLLTSLMSDDPPPVNIGGFSAIDQDDASCDFLAQFSLPPSKRVPRPFDLTIANRLWIQAARDANILPEFEQLLEKQYLSSTEEIDFMRKGPESAQRINDWVSLQTWDRIKQIVSPDDFNSLTRFVAVNAVFFQGRWRDPFLPRKTQLKPFYDSDGKTQLGEVPMMSLSRGIYDIRKIDGVTILRKPYVGEASFFILLPPPGEGELEKLEASLSDANLRKWVTSTESELLTKLEIPKFELESTFPLIDIMKQLGVKKLFDENGADFSGMVPSDSDWTQEPLFVYLMRHKATLKVDEVGTVATAAGMGGGCFGGMIEPKPQEFVANRPFLFLIFDEKTSSLLFMGRYAGPKGPRGMAGGGFF